MAAIVGAAGLRADAGRGARRQAACCSPTRKRWSWPARSSWRAVRERGATLLPIDSEHNAVFQCLPRGVTASLAARAACAASC